MTTKDYLSQIHRLDLMIEAKNNEIERLRALACKITVPIEGERVKSSSDPDKMTNTVAKIIKLEDELVETIASYVEKRKLIVSQIDKISETKNYNFLTLRYVETLPMKEIKGKMGIEDSELFRTQRTALKEFENTFGVLYLRPGDQREMGNLKKSQSWQ